MRLLLVNINPAVSRLITLSAKKLDYELLEVPEFEGLQPESYDIAFIDSDSFDKEVSKDAKDAQIAKYFVYIGSRNSNKPEGMDSMLEKPFLPTDFVEMIKEIEKLIEDTPAQEFEEEKLEEMDEEAEAAHIVDLDDSSLPHEKEIYGEEDLEDFGKDLKDDLKLEAKDDFPNLEEASEDEDLVFENGDEESPWKYGSILDSEDVREVQELLEDDKDEGEEFITTSFDSKDNFDEDESIDDLLAGINGVESEETLENAEKFIDEEETKDKLMEETVNEEKKLGEFEIPELEDGLLDDLFDSEDELEDINLEETEEEKDIELSEEPEKEELEIPSLEDELDDFFIEEELKPVSQNEELSDKSGFDKDEETEDVDFSDDFEDDKPLELPKDEELEIPSLENEETEDIDFSDDFEGEKSLELPKDEELEIPSLEDELQDTFIGEDMDDKISFSELAADQEKMSLEDKLEDAFSEEELEDELKEENFVSTAEDPFVGLSEAELKLALGEAVEEMKMSPKDNNEALKIEIKNEVSKALVSALSQTRIKEALKNMKINISVSFEEN